MGPTATLFERAKEMLADRRPLYHLLGTLFGHALPVDFDQRLMLPAGKGAV